MILKLHNEYVKNAITLWYHDKIKYICKEIITTI